MEHLDESAVMVDAFADSISVKRGTRRRGPGVRLDRADPEGQTTTSPQQSSLPQLSARPWSAPQRRDELGRVEGRERRLPLCLPVHGGSMKVRGDENPHWKRTKVPGDRPRPTPSRVHGCRFSPSPRSSLGGCQVNDECQQQDPKDPEFTGDLEGVIEMVDVGGKSREVLARWRRPTVPDAQAVGGAHAGRRSRPRLKPRTPRWRDSLPRGAHWPECHQRNVTTEPAGRGAPMERPPWSTTRTWSLNQLLYAVSTWVPSGLR